MSPRRLSGWEPRTVTEYVYEGDRLIRSVTTREPEFTQRDTNYFLAFEALEAELGSHGFPMSEATAKTNEHAFVAAEMPTIDFAAQSIGAAQDAYYRSWPNAPRHGHLWSTRKKSVAPE